MKANEAVELITGRQEKNTRNLRQAYDRYREHLNVAQLLEELDSKKIEKDKEVSPEEVDEQARKVAAAKAERAAARQRRISNKEEVKDES